MLPKHAEESGRERGGGGRRAGDGLSWRASPLLRPLTLCRSGPRPDGPHPPRCSSAEAAAAPPGCSCLSQGQPRGQRCWAWGGLQICGTLSRRRWLSGAEIGSSRTSSLIIRTVQGPAAGWGAKLRAAGQLAHQGRLRAGGGPGQAWTRPRVLDWAESEHQNHQGLCECRSAGPVRAD